VRKRGHELERADGERDVEFPGGSGNIGEGEDTGTRK